jgi:hypothetical protein
VDNVGSCASTLRRHLCWLQDERLEALSGIKQGLADAVAGRTQTVVEAFSDIRKAFGVPLRFDAQVASTDALSGQSLAHPTGLLNEPAALDFSWRASGAKGPPIPTTDQRADLGSHGTERRDICHFLPT